MPRVAVVIPYRDDPTRAALLAHLVPRWLAVVDEIAIEDAPPGPWRKGAAVAAGLAHTTADIVVVADADVWCHDLSTAIAVVADVGRWAVPHGEVRRLTPTATSSVLDGAPLTDDLDLEEPAYRGVVGGGLVVFPRALALEVPLDPRFAGWGGEDHAWGYALTAVAGRCWRPDRGESPCWHLWHPPQPRRDRVVGNDASEHLRLRYQNARSSATATRQLLAEIGGT